MGSTVGGVLSENEGFGMRLGRFFRNFRFVDGSVRSSGVPDSLPGMGAASDGRMRTKTVVITTSVDN